MTFLYFDLPLGGAKLWDNKENQSAVLQLLCPFTTGKSLSLR